MSKKTARRLHLNDEQTARLLKLGLNDSDTAACQDLEDQRKELLSDMLCSKLPVDGMLTKILPILIKSLSDELVAVSGFSLRDCLTNPATKPVILRRIKDFAKDSGAAAQTQAQAEVAKIVYFAAVAVALVYHGTRITGHAYQDLLRSFQLCAQQTWIPQDLMEVFAKATVICERRA